MGDRPRAHDEPVEVTPILFESEAIADLLHAYDWYEDRRAGLGTRFRTALDEAIARVAENPGRFPTIYRDLRRILLYRFPYAVYYRVYPSHVAVVAVFHGKRSPSTLQDR